MCELGSAKAHELSPSAQQQKTRHAQA